MTKTATNIGLPQWGVKCFYEIFVLNGSAVLLLNISAKNPPLRQAEKRWHAIRLADFFVFARDAFGITFSQPKTCMPSIWSLGKISAKPDGLHPSGRLAEILSREKKHRNPKINFGLLFFFSELRQATISL